MIFQSSHLLQIFTEVTITGLCRCFFQIDFSFFQLGQQLDMPVLCDQRDAVRRSEQQDMGRRLQTLQK